MAAKIVYASVVAGLGWTTYFAIPTVIGTGVMLAQGQMPHWEIKDFANLGGFAVFATAMYFLHRESIQRFSADMKDEREHRAKHTETLAKHMSDNTVATVQLTAKIEEFIRGK